MNDSPCAIADDITDVLLPAIVRLVARADYDGDKHSLLRIQKRLVGVVRDMTREEVMPVPDDAPLAR